MIMYIHVTTAITRVLFKFDETGDLDNVVEDRICKSGSGALAQVVKRED